MITLNLLNDQVVHRDIKVACFTCWFIPTRFFKHSFRRLMFWFLTLYSLSTSCFVIHCPMMSCCSFAALLPTAWNFCSCWIKSASRSLTLATQVRCFCLLISLLCFSGLVFQVHTFTFWLLTIASVRPLWRFWRFDGNWRVSRAWVTLWGCRDGFIEDPRAWYFFIWCLNICARNQRAYSLASNSVVEQFCEKLQQSRGIYTSHVSTARWAATESSNFRSTNGMRIHRLPGREQSTCPCHYSVSLACWFTEYLSTSVIACPRSIWLIIA